MSHGYILKAHMDKPTLFDDVMFLITKRLSSFHYRSINIHTIGPNRWVITHLFWKQLLYGGVNCYNGKQSLEVFPMATLIEGVNNNLFGNFRLYHKQNLPLGAHTHGFWVGVGLNP